MDLRAGTAGDHDSGHHPLHGRGGALPAARLPLPRAPDRGRNCRRGAGAVRAALDRGRLHRAAAPGRRGRGMRLWPMLWKELVQLRRDRFTLAMMLGIPAIQLALFGYAIQTEVRHLATVVLDESRTPESRRLIEVLRNTGNFDVIEQVRSRTELA